MGHESNNLNPIKLNEWEEKKQMCETLDYQEDTPSCEHCEFYPLCKD